MSFNSRACAFPRASPRRCRRPASFPRRNRGYRTLRRQPHHLEITDDDRKRFYILGTGRESLWLAANLRWVHPEPPPVTMLCSSNPRIDSFYQQGGKIQIIQGDEIREARGVDMETLLIQPNDLQISSRPVWNRHFHFGGYVVESEVDSQPPTVVDAQSQHAPPPKPLADLRTLYQQTSSKNKSRFNASNASSSTKDFEDTMKLPSERTLKPILNLIIPTTASFKPDIIHGITTRLDVETSLFLIGKSLGILEHWSETVFRDPRARPNFFRGIMT